MACSTVSTRIISNKLSFIALLFILSPLVLKSGEFELGLEFTYDKVLSVFLSGSYNTDYIKAKANINPYQPFPNNISLQALPVYKPNNTKIDNAISTALAASVTTAGGVLFYVTKKEIERRIENQNIDLYLQRCDEAIEKSNPVFEKIERRRSHD